MESGMTNPALPQIKKPPVDRKRSRLANDGGNPPAHSQIQFKLQYPRKTCKI